MDNFLYKVPFFDFSTNTAEENGHNTEEFFDIEHENHNGVLPNEYKIPVPVNDNVDERFYSTSPQGAKLRRSISMVNLPVNNDNEDTQMIINGIGKLQIRSTKKNRVTPQKIHLMTTRADSCRFSRIRGRTMDALNICMDAKPHTTTNKYVSMAEEINKFQQKTPSRFHSQPKTVINPTTKNSAPLIATIPHSPALQTKLRIRTASLMTKEEREIKELEEAKKHQIKANPVNFKILEGPLPLKTATEVLKKAPTIPEPFKLSEASVKKSVSTERRVTDFHFHAKPVPKCIFQPPQPILKSNLHTNATTPNFLRRLTVYKKENETVTEAKNKAPEYVKLTVTKPIPFSFDQRDKGLIKKREQLKNEFLKEEQRAREFHAKPVPKIISQMAQARSNITLIPERARSNEIVEKNDFKAPNAFTFKARPSTVVHAKPFVPKKEDRTLTEISEFKLNTEERAKNRSEFEKAKKEKEDRHLVRLQQAANLKLQQEEEELAKYRKENRIKANPIRKYKEVQPVATKKLTSPKSPKFLSGQKKNKENSAE